MRVLTIWIFTVSLLADQICTCESRASTRSAVPYLSTPIKKEIKRKPRKVDAGNKKAKASNWYKTVNSKFKSHKSSGMDKDDPTLKYKHDGWQTCSINSPKLRSMNGRYFSLGPPSKAYGGIQIFARDHQIRAMLPPLLLHIPAAANAVGNFERWVLFNAFFNPQLPLGQVDHQQVFQTTNSDNGTEWEVVLNQHALRLAEQGNTKFLDELNSLAPPNGSVYCVSGHTIGPNDRILRKDLMKSPDEAKLLIQPGDSPLAQTLNRARIECQAFTFSFTARERPILDDSDEAMLAGKAVCEAANSQPDKYLTNTRLFVLKMAHAHHDMLTRHLSHAAELYMDVIRTCNKWQDKSPLDIEPILGAQTMYEIYHDIIPTLIQDRRYSDAELLYTQMQLAPVFEAPRERDLKGTRKIQERMDKLLPLVKLRLRKYMEAAELYISAQNQNTEHDFVSAYLFEWTVQRLLAQQSHETIPPNVLRVYNESKALYQATKERAQIDYTGFVPPDSSWQPRRFKRLPTHAELMDYIKRREPFIIAPPRNPNAFGATEGCEDSNSSGSNLNMRVGQCPTGLPGTCLPIAEEHLQRDCPPLLQMLGWERTCLWDADQMCEMAGSKQVSLALKSNDTAEMDTFSGSTTNARNFTSFCEYARAVMDPDSPHKDVSKRVGYFDAGSANSMSGQVSHADDGFPYDFPLDRLQDQIPFPSFFKMDPDELQVQDMLLLSDSNDMNNSEQDEICDEMDMLDSKCNIPAKMKQYVNIKNETVIKIYSATFWMGSAGLENGGQCGLHYDALENFHFLLSGHKRWKIYSPADALNLDYILPVSSVSAGGDFEQVPWDGDLKVFNFQTRFSKAQTVHQGLTSSLREHHPDFQRGTQIEFELQGGEAVYLPGGWAHDIKSHGIYKSITYWFFRSLEHMEHLEGRERVGKLRKLASKPKPFYHKS